MPKQPVRKKIDKYEFEFYPMPPRVALKLLTRLTKILGKPLGLAADTFMKLGNNGEKGILETALNANIPSDAFAKVMEALAENLEEDQVVDTIETLLESVHGQFEKDRGTRRLQFDIDFAGQTPLLLKVVAAALEVNYGDFFAGGLGNLVTRGRPEMVTSQANH